MSQSRGDTAVASREEAENVYVNGMAGNELAGYVQQGRDLWFPVQCWVLDAVPGSRAPDCVRGESHLGRRPRGWSPPPSRLTLCVCVCAQVAVAFHRSPGLVSSHSAPGNSGK